MIARLQKIEQLWRKWLAIFQQPELEKEMLSRWQGDRNVVERISFEYPPVFQPGFVGIEYGRSPRIVFLGYKPGEGASPEAVQSDKVLSNELSRFAKGTVGFREYNHFLSKHVFLWNIYADMGIFSEQGADRLSLIPESLRPSVNSVALLNAFPFKTQKNKPPLRQSALASEAWRDFTLPMLQELEPELVVHYPAVRWCRREVEELGARAVGVWHPSYNASTRPRELEEKWEPLRTALSVRCRNPD